MPSQETVDKARRDLSEGKKPSTAAGEFVREEMEHIREGRHGARNTKQAIAIGLSKARRAGVPLQPPEPGEAPAGTRRSAARELATGQGRRQPRTPSPRRKRAAMTALQREPRKAASPKALRRQAKSAAARRGPVDRARAAKAAAVTKGAKGRSQAAKRAAATRKRHRT
ncbi:MAG TPA: DNA-binding protein [Polyangia bacterium]|nr:DNA-binding protein [Polyangia bacterium]